MRESSDSLLLSHHTPTILPYPLLVRGGPKLRSAPAPACRSPRRPGEPRRRAPRPHRAAPPARRPLTCARRNRPRPAVPDAAGDSHRGARASAGRSVGRAAPPRSASMRTAWPSRAVRDRPAMPWGRAPDRPPAGTRSPPGPRPVTLPRHPGRQPPRRHSHRLRPGRDPDRRPRPAPDQPRHAPHAPSTGAQPPMWTRSGAARRLSELPITRPSALRSGPIGFHHGPRATFADRPAGRRAVMGARRGAGARLQGPPAPYPGHPAQFPPAPCARGPIGAHTHDGFRILGSDFGFWN